MALFKLDLPETDYDPNSNSMSGNPVNNLTEEEIEQGKEKEKQDTATKKNVLPRYTEAPEDEKTLTKSQRVNKWFEANKYTEPIKDEEKERRLKRKRDISNLTEAFRTVGEGIFGTKGYKIPKHKKNTIFSKTQREIDLLNQNFDASLEKTRLMNLGVKREANAKIESDDRYNAALHTAAENEKYKRLQDAIAQHNIEAANRLRKEIADDRITSTEKINADKNKAKLGEVITREKGLNYRTDARINKNRTKNNKDFIFKHYDKDIIIKPKDFDNEFYKIKKKLKEITDSGKLELIMQLPQDILDVKDGRHLKTSFTTEEKRAIIRDYYHLAYPDDRDPKPKPPTPEERSTWDKFWGINKPETDKPVDKKPKKVGSIFN